MKINFYIIILSTVYKLFKIYLKIEQQKIKLLLI